MNKKYVTITVIASMLVLSSSIFFAYSKNNPSPTPEHADAVHEEHDDERERAAIVGDEELSNEMVQTTLIPVAEKALIAYVQQQTSESSNDRINRLKPFFSSKSTTPTAERPSVNIDKFASYSATATALYSDWSTASDAVIVSTAIKIIVKDTQSAKEKLLYQTYDISMKKDGATYQPINIAYSSVPVMLTKEERN